MTLKSESNNPQRLRELRKEMQQRRDKEADLVLHPRPARLLNLLLTVLFLAGGTWCLFHAIREGILFFNADTSSFDTIRFALFVVQCVCTMILSMSTSWAYNRLLNTEHILLENLQATDGMIAFLDEKIAKEQQC